MHLSDASSRPAQVRDRDRRLWLVKGDTSDTEGSVQIWGDRGQQGNGKFDLGTWI